MRQTPEPAARRDTDGNFHIRLECGFSKVHGIREASATLTTRSRLRTQRFPFCTFAASPGLKNGSPSGHSSGRILPVRSRHREALAWRGGHDPHHAAVPHRLHEPGDEADVARVVAVADVHFYAFEPHSSGRPRYTSVAAEHVEEEVPLHMHGRGGAGAPRRTHSSSKAAQMWKYADLSACTSFISDAKRACRPYRMKLDKDFQRPLFWTSPWNR